MEYREPGTVEKIFNKTVGLIAGSRFAPGDLYLLVFYGRKTGKRYTTPVFMLEFKGSNYLVAPRGETQWVRNVRKSRSLVLKRGKNEQLYMASEITGVDKAEILKAYFEKYKSTVTSFFPENLGSDIGEYEAISENYPIFRIEI